MQRVWHANRESLFFRKPGSVPFWDFDYIMFYLLTPILINSVFSNLPFSFWLFDFEYPSVLSRFCLLVYDQDESSDDE